MAERPADPQGRHARRPGRRLAGGGVLSLLHRTDLGISLIILAICAALFYATTTFDEVSQLLAQNISPAFFPRLVLYFIAALALLLPFEHLAHARSGKNIDADRSNRIRRMPYLSAGLLILAVVALPHLGMLLSMVAVCALLPLLWGERRWKLILAFAIVFPLLVTVVFNRILLVHFEPGLLDISP